MKKLIISIIGLIMIFLSGCLTLSKNKDQFIYSLKTDLKLIPADLMAFFGADEPSALRRR